MIILLDTATPMCRLTMVDEDRRVTKEWEAHRELAAGLLGYLEISLAELGYNFQDLSGIVAFRGPGSFTGLRIGLTVLNTLADSLAIPIIGTYGEQWQQDGLTRLEQGENDHLVMPEYGGEAHITLPKK